MLLKIRAFRCFHAIHHTSCTGELHPRLWSLGTLDQLCSHDSTRFAVVADGASVAGRPHRLSTLRQSSVVKGHEASMWDAFSGALWHRLHDALCGHPHLARLSAVRHWFSTASHENILHFMVASAFQMIYLKSVCVDPSNWITYADANMNHLSAIHFHSTQSGWLGQKEFRREKGVDLGAGLLGPRCNLNANPHEGHWWGWLVMCTHEAETASLEHRQICRNKTLPLWHHDRHTGRFAGTKPCTSIATSTLFFVFCIVCFMFSKKKTSEHVSIRPFFFIF